MDVVNILVGLLVAALVYYVAGLFLASPIPLIIALLVLVLVIFGNGAGRFGRV